MNDNQIIFAVVFITLIILLLIAGVIITTFISNRQRLKQEMKLVQQSVDYEKELRRINSEVQEQLLVNVAIDLHDNVGQLLNVMLSLTGQRKNENPDVAIVLNELEEMMIEVMQRVRFLGRSLNSDLLEKNGLMKTMDAEMARLSHLNHFVLHWENDQKEPKLNKDQRLMTFRIFQEVINNILKHAKAKNVFITLIGKERFRLTISDDGRGFDLVEKMNASEGSGLKNIMKRAEMAQLNCVIETAVGKGSQFVIE